MRRISVHLLLAFSVLIALTPNDDARAAELKLLVTNGTRSIVDELGPQFERTTGHKLLIKYEGSPFLQKAIEAGEAFDVVLITAKSMDAIAKAGKVDATTRTTVARSGIGVAMLARGPRWRAEMREHMQDRWERRMHSHFGPGWANLSEAERERFRAGMRQWRSRSHGGCAGQSSASTPASDGSSPKSPVDPDVRDERR